MPFPINANLVKAQVTVLTLAQALAMTTNTVLITTAALVGYAIATDKALATVPLAMRQVATMAATIPASMLMARIGRRGGFLLGTAIGVLGAGMSIYSLVLANFWLFTLAMTLLGFANGFVGYYRFAAADIADNAFRSQAISWVIAGGIVAAVLGPWLATGSQRWFESDEVYVGAFVAVLALQLLSAFCLLFLNIPHITKRQVRENVRSLPTIARQPKFWVATVGSTLSYGVMAFIMTATPLAMTVYSHSFSQSATVIQWHVLGMFGPALLTGWLIKRFGVIAIIITGAVLNLGCIAINLAGTGFWNFAIALLFLGLGWNFMYVGSTTLLTETYAPHEKAKVQAAHDFTVFSFVALATFFSGRIFYRFDWDMLNQLSWPLVLTTLAGVIWLQHKRLAA